jgi:hypothetical protein
MTLVFFRLMLQNIHEEAILNCCRTVFFSDVGTLARNITFQDGVVCYRTVFIAKAVCVSANRLATTF